MDEGGDAMMKITITRIKLMLMMRMKHHVMPYRLPVLAVLFDGEKIQKERHNEDWSEKKPPYISTLCIPHSFSLSPCFSLSLSISLSLAFSLSTSLRTDIRNDPQNEFHLQPNR